METAILETFEKPEPSTNSTFRGIMIDSREERKTTFDSMLVNSESLSNESDKNDLQSEKCSEQRI
jgi:hypothetical protein